jgi:hypothetical protein
MAAFDDVDVTELRAPANPLAVKGNTVYTRTVRFIVATSSTVAAGDLTGLKLPPGTMVIAAIIDTDTSFGSTTLALSTETSSKIFVAAKAVTVTGGESCVIAANLGVVVPSSATADDQVILTLGAATSPASEVEVELTLVLMAIGPVESTYETYDT